MCMKEINQILNNSQTKIFFGASLSYLFKLANPKNSLILTDTNIYEIYKDEIKEFPVVCIPSGEKSKSLDIVNDIYQKLLDLKFDRDSLLIGFGGGVVCDIAGFVAATFKRGINLGLVPTTLLSQIDASIGGKNAVNFNNFKNIIGTFKQAKFILSDIRTLRTLPKIEMLNAYAELVKTALISDDIFFTDLNNNIDKLLNFDEDYLNKIIYQCAKIKSDIVAKDEKENDLRRILNFGHTFGHAIESTKNISHGRAISIGMGFALQLSNKLLDFPFDKVQEILDLLSKLKLPIGINFDKQKIIKAISNDKKRYNDSIKFVLLEKIGKPVILDIELQKLERLINDLS